MLPTGPAGTAFRRDGGKEKRLRRASADEPPAHAAKQIRLAAAKTPRQAPPENALRRTAPTEHPASFSAARERSDAPSSAREMPHPPQEPARTDAQQKALRRRVLQRLRLADADISIPGRTSLELMSVGINTRKSYAKLIMQLAAWTFGLTQSPLELAPDLTWDQAIRFVLGLRSDLDELNDAMAQFTHS